MRRRVEGTMRKLRMGNFVPPNATEPAHSQSIVTKAGAYTITDYQHFFYVPGSKRERMGGHDKLQ